MIILISKLLFDICAKSFFIQKVINMCSLICHWLIGGKSLNDKLLFTILNGLFGVKFFFDCFCFLNKKSDIFLDHDLSIGVNKKKVKGDEKHKKLKGDTEKLKFSRLNITNF